MANKILQKIRKLELIRDSLNKIADQILNKYKKEIVDLNYNQMIDGYGSDNKNLFNIHREYKGVYHKGYKKQGLYDFFETGAFKRGLFATIKNNEASIDSRGKGTGDKKIFFDGYNNIFGLNNYSKEKLKRLISPELKRIIYEKSRI